MDKNAKIYIAGHRGLVGSAIWKNLTDKGYTNLVGRTHTELDLLDSVAVKDFFDKERPDYVVVLDEMPYLTSGKIDFVKLKQVAEFDYENIKQGVLTKSLRA